ncbi:MAG: hypothetical protein R6U78_17330, partial [Bacteroidales bacterium]
MNWLAQFPGKEDLLTVNFHIFTADNEIYSEVTEYSRKHFIAAIPSCVGTKFFEKWFCGNEQ